MTLKEKIIEHLKNDPGATDSELEVIFNVRHQAVIQLVENWQLKEF